MNNTAFALLTLILTSGADSASAQAHKCTVNGKIIYQQTPCADGQKVNISGAGKGDPSSPASVQVQREIARFKHKERVEAAILEGKVFIGMTREELVKSWGNPSKINKTLAESGASEQWIYRRSGVGYDQYVYLDDGVIRTIQSSE